MNGPATVLWQSDDKLSSVESTEEGTFICLRFPVKMVARVSSVFPARVTRMEAKVLALVLDNKPDKEIAAELGISLRTAKYHVHNLLKKFKVDKRTKLVLSSLAAQA